MLKMSNIDQVHLRAVMICMLKMSKMGKEHTHTFLLINFLIFNFQPYHQILCILKHVEDVEDRSSTLKERL